MCLIVFKEDESSVFTNRQFKNMIRRNRHGLGIMFRENGRVIVDKSVAHEKAKASLWHKYRDKPMYAMHARLTTHGETNLENCHPFKIMSIDDGDPIDLYMMHNGVINHAPEIDKKMSDTWHFAEYVLKPIVRNNLDLLWNNEAFQEWISKTIGGSKLLFMRSDDIDEPVLILNASAGIEENGCWLSNGYSTNTFHTNYNRNSANNNNYTSYNRSSQSNVNPTTPLKITHLGNTGTDQFTELANSQRQTNFNVNNVDKTARLFLPSANNSSKIVPLHSSEVKTEEQHLYEIVSTLKGLSMYAVKEWVKDDPDLAADIILALYEKNTMPYELIIQQIKDEQGIDGIVDVIRHIVSFNSIPKTIRN